MAQALQKKAEAGDVKAFDAWKRLTDELEAERLARDGADGARAWEALTPEQRRLLLSVLEGGHVVIARHEHEQLLVAAGQAAQGGSSEAE